MESIDFNLPFQGLTESYMRNQLPQDNLQSNVDLSEHNFTLPKTSSPHRSTMDPADANNFALPDQPSSVSRGIKRPRGSLDSAGSMQRPTRKSRPSPSPETSNASTPSGRSTPPTDKSFGFDVDDPWSKFVGDTNPDDWLREAEEEMKAIERRQAQEKEDAAMARRLQDQGSSPVSHPSTGGASGSDDSGNQQFSGNGQSSLGGTSHIKSPRKQTSENTYRNVFGDDEGNFASPSSSNAASLQNRGFDHGSTFQWPGTPQRSIPLHPATPSKMQNNSPNFGLGSRGNSDFITLDDSDEEGKDEGVTGASGSSTTLAHSTPYANKTSGSAYDSVPIVDLLSDEVSPLDNSYIDLTAPVAQDYGASNLYGLNNGYANNAYGFGAAPSYPSQTGFGNVYLDNTYDPYGNIYQNPYDPNAWTSTANNFLGSVGSAAKGAFTAAGNMINNQLNNYGSSANNFFDLTNDDYLQTSQPAYPSRSAFEQDLVSRYRERFPEGHGGPGSLGAEDVKKLLENIRPDEELAPEDREGTPEAMLRPLMEHQKNGLTWMKNMEEGSSKGGILADEMGLGKTIQAIALMLSRPSNDPKRKITLIVAPVGLLRQWQREIETKLKSTHALKTYILHGSQRDTPFSKLKHLDVVLTSMGTLASEFKRKEAIDLQKRHDPNWQPRSNRETLPLLGDDSKWYRVILDEAQCIKCKSTKASLAAAMLKSEHRWCMTGTPMMNNVGELWPYLRFLRVKPYNDERRFKAEIVTPISKNFSGVGQDKAMQKLQALLKAILLRRTKKSKIDGRPILSLPPKTITAQNAVFSDDERAFYDALEQKSQLTFNKYLKKGKLGNNYSGILVLLLRLRQACCHPHLCQKEFLPESGTTGMSHDKMVKLANTLKTEVIERIKDAGQQNVEGEHGLVCPVCLETSANAIIFIPCGHSTCSECFTRITDPSQAIAAGEAEGQSGGKCPECRGKVSTEKIIDHDTFKEVHQGDLRQLMIDDVYKSEEAETDDDDDGDDDDDSEADEKGNLTGFVVDDEDSDGDNKDSIMRYFQPESGKKKRKGKGKAKVRKTLAELKKESSKNQKAKKRYLARLQKEYEPSGKIEKCMEILRGIYDRNDGAKTIIFSQFTSLLDLLEVPVNGENWAYQRYDGSMSATHRNEAVVKFSDDPNMRLMLVSLKAGNAGLNLTSASEVIIFDPFWNPYVEDQAIDRAHRIGQMRQVNVHRIFVQNTVEDRILSLQEKKRALIEGALDEKAAGRISRLGERELGFLFGLRGDV